MIKIKTYFKETYDELMNKVSWPSWTDLQSSAIVVSIASLIIATMVFIIDIIFGINGNINKFDPESYKVIWRGVLGFFYWFLL
ncbi:MAG: preprotein translocase subunit SecE [Bacteroidetes bacterium CG2_30_32_10]|nr:MAG: preprotein translocase subunit SecE [Bacteroidetes bacterium CG2_30_32_10]